MKGVRDATSDPISRSCPANVFPLVVVGTMAQKVAFLMKNAALVQARAKNIALVQARAPFFIKNQYK